MDAIRRTNELQLIEPGAAANDAAVPAGRSLRIVLRAFCNTLHGTNPSTIPYVAGHVVQSKLVRLKQANRGGMCPSSYPCQIFHGHLGMVRFNISSAIFPPRIPSGAPSPHENLYHFSPHRAAYSPLGFGWKPVTVRAEIGSHGLSFLWV